MPKKTSIKKSAAAFGTSANAIAGFVAAGTNLSKEHQSWAHEYAAIRLYREFEHLILHVLVGAVNNDTSTIAQRTGVTFPKHLTRQVCEYLLIGDGYFDFRGRDGLIATVKRYVPDGHYILTIIKDKKYKAALEQLCALRNLAAHDSAVSKARAKDALGVKNLGTAGSWLKTQGRLNKIITSLKQLASDIEQSAPY